MGGAGKPGTVVDDATREEHPLDRLASPRVDRPIDLKLLTPTNAAT